MRMHRLMIAGCVMAACLAIDASAQVEGGKGKFQGKFQGKFGDKGRMQSGSNTILTDPLEPAEVVAKLKLTGTQKTAADKVLKEYDAKLKELAAKAPAAGNGGAPTGGKFSKFKGKGDGAGTANPAIEKAIELRGEYAEKFEALLTEPQKKILEEAHIKMGEALLSGGNKK
ncbi:MAG: hypothetical protein JNM56_20790 [Planctomycetia bacterium]|nr:hypothetical protein [Planctomycetia bacterium]